MRTVTLIGSGRFDQTYQTCVALLTGLGIVVFTHGYHSPEVPALPEDQEQRRAAYNFLMLDKIQRSDAVLVIDVDSANDQIQANQGYVGVETAKGILWASIQDIPTIFLSDLMAGVLKTGGVTRAMSDFDEALTDGEILVMHIDPALELLAHATGRERVAEAQTNTARDIMHASLSHIAVDPTANQEIATETLNFLDLVILPAEQRDQYLALVDPHSSLPRTREVVGG